jgi:hypothetical protein
VETAVDVLASEGVEAWPIGDIRPVAELGARYVEA